MAVLTRRQRTGGARSGRIPMSALVDALKALAHPGRLRLLAMLQGGDLCVCQMTAVLGLAASTVSGHLSDLRHAGLVAERKSGKWVHYRLVTEGPLGERVREILRLAAADLHLAADARRIGMIRQMPLEDFCRTGLVTGSPVPGSRVRRSPRRSSARSA